MIFCLSCKKHTKDIDPVGPVGPVGPIGPIHHINIIISKRYSINVFVIMDNSTIYTNFFIILTSNIFVITAIHYILMYIFYI